MKKEASLVVGSISCRIGGPLDLIPVFVSNNSDNLSTANLLKSGSEIMTINIQYVKL